jgi:phosphoglycolate phosphatase
LRDNRTCLIDLDGTLTDPFKGISRCITYALELMEFPVPDNVALRQWIGPPLKTSFQHYFASRRGGDADRAVQLYRERFASVGLFENSVYEGIPALLEMLAGQSNRLVLATAKPTVYARRIIRHFELEQWFEGIHGSELDGRRTDKSELLQHIINQRGLFPAECVMIGDREHDMRAACSHGMNTVGVLWGYGTPLELLDAGAETLVASPSELMELLTDQLD